MALLFYIKRYFIIYYKNKNLLKENIEIVFYLQYFYYINIAKPKNIYFLNIYNYISGKKGNK